MTGATILARREHFPLVGSTNDVVARWLADGVPEVCLATAGEQTAGRGREGRSWQAPRGTNFLASLGFRPTWLTPDRAWQLAAIVSLAMAAAGERVAKLGPGTIRLKWPNDLVVDGGGRGSAIPVRKLAGVLGETAGLGTRDPRAVIGVGVNVDWSRDDFPADLADGMTSLREAAAGRAVDARDLEIAFVEQLEPLVDGLRRGTRFPAAEWRARQITNGRDIDLVESDGARVPVHAVDVDVDTGGLVVVAAESGDARRTILSGEIVHVRFPLTERIPAPV